MLTFSEKHTALSRPLEAALLRALIGRLHTGRPPVVVCIGTDRVIGDCLGPMVGALLEKTAGGQLPVYGTLRSTVHALNLPSVSTEINKRHPGQPVIAVDASLGSCETVGSVLVRCGCLHPGAGVSKRLPAVGDIAITGIVGCETCHPYLDLQTVRLSSVAEMAERTAACILEACGLI